MTLSPPRPPAIPLTALRAFEAAARHESFPRAAEELGVTPGAIAQQIKKLEGWLGVQLFGRHAQGVSLTPEAARALPALTQGFDTLGQAVQALRQGAATTTVRIAALPAVAQLWLSPRLSALRAQAPGCDLSIHALDLRPPVSRGAFDLTIYPMDPADADAAEVTLLSRNSLLPVAAPDIARRLRDPTDLAGETLIHDAAWASDWRAWLASHGVAGVDPSRGPTHSLYSIAVERCLAGDGVLIGHTALIGPHLADGRLVAPFPGLSIAGQPLCLSAPMIAGAEAVQHVAQALVRGA